MIKHLEELSRSLEYGSFFLMDGYFLSSNIPDAIINSSRYFYIISPNSSGIVKNREWYIRNTYKCFAPFAKVRKVFIDNEVLTYEEFDINVNGKNIHCRYDYDLTFDGDRVLPDITGKQIKTHNGIKTISAPYGSKSIIEYIDRLFINGEDVCISYSTKEDGKVFDVSTKKLINKVKRYERVIK